MGGGGGGGRCAVFANTRGGREGGFRIGQVCTLGEGQWSVVKGPERRQRLALALPPALPCHQAQQSLVAGQAC